MARAQNLGSLQRRICSWDLEPRRLDSLKSMLELQLRFLPQVTWHKLKSIDDQNLLPCDLLVVYAGHLGEEELLVWLQGFEKRLKKQEAIWIPALIITPLELTRVEDLLDMTLKSNWYFDLIHPDHFSSLSVRVANLLRIHDHLHELLRYETEIQKLQAAVHQVESELDDFKKGLSK